jgi:hypothetical protein
MTTRDRKRVDEALDLYSRRIDETASTSTTGKR